MMLTHRAEELLEILWVDLIENQRERCDARILKNDDSLKELVDSGYGRIQDNQITLTTKGEEEGKNCIRRHRLAERLLVDVLALKGNMVHETGCRFEHILHRGLDENICTLLGHPRTCPHGRPIPEGGCCGDAKREPKKVIMPLTALGVNKRARIAYLQTQERGALQKMIAMGALPKTEITLIQKFPSYVFQIGKSQFAIDKELAYCIYVRIE